MARSLQLFAFEIDTHDSAKINTILSAEGISPWEMTQEHYLHRQVNLQTRLIRDQVLPRTANGVLPVFMAPEFFFKWRNGEPFDRAAFFNSIEYFEAASGAFPDVLWVVGSMWWKEPADETYARVHNTAMVFQGGRLLRSWQKTRLSRIDGLDRAVEVWDRWDVASSRVLEMTQDPILVAALPGGGVATVGIEVCLDHATLAGPPPEPGVLRTKYLAAHPDEKEGPGVDVHLLVAAGMEMQPENVVARTGGVFFRCDGGRGALRSQSVRISRPGPNPPQQLRLWQPTTNNDVPIYVGHDVDNRLAVYNLVSLP